MTAKDGEIPMQDPPIRNLVWLDLEMTGLSPDEDRILEIATLITNKELDVIAEGPNMAIYQEEEVLRNMNMWSREQHQLSGLTERVRLSSIEEKEAEERTLAFISQYVSPLSSPLCGNSVHQDRMFMRRYMPKLEKFLHYRNLDVTSLKIAAQLWNPDLLDELQKKDAHLALSDIYESIAELKTYKKLLLIT